MDARIPDPDEAQAIWFIEPTKAVTFVTRLIVIATKASCEAHAKIVTAQKAQVLPESRGALGAMIIVNNKVVKGVSC